MDIEIFQVKNLAWSKLIMEYFKDIIQKVITFILIKPDDSEEEKAKKINLYYFIGSPILLIIISSIIFIIFTSSNDKVKVPMIKGDSIYDAVKKLSDKKLVTSVITKYTDEADAGIVYMQSPNQGSVVKRGRVVVLNVSLGPIKSELPDFVKSNLFDVEDYLNKEFPSGSIPFKIEDPVYEFNEEVEKGKIFDQDPKSGIPISDVKKLKFWISNGTKDESVKLIKNYIERNIEDVSKDLAELEIFYTFEFEVVKDKAIDMIITAQSISEGVEVEELMEEGKKLILKVNKYLEIDKNKIKGTYPLDLPDKPIPYLVEVKIKDGISKEKRILKIKTKGGVTIPIPYSGTIESSLQVYFDDKFQDEIKLNMEVKVDEVQ